MGLYDYYDDIQLKAGPCVMHTYKAGDETGLLTSGVYVGYEGLVVIQDGKLLLTFTEGRLFDKWGGCIHEEDVLATSNPVVRAIREATASHDTLE